jgi:hypothetical protein
VDFFAVDFFAGDDFFAALVDFLAVAVVFFAVDFFAGVDFFAALFVAVDVFFAVFLAGEDDFFAALFVAVAFLVAVFLAVDDDFFAALFEAVAVFLAVLFAAPFLAAADLLAVSFFAVGPLTPGIASAAAASVSFGSFFAPETTFFRSAPALNFGIAVFLALIRSPVRGLRTQRASRTRFSNEPKPVMATFSPRATSRVIVSSTDSNACAAALRLPS